MNNITQQSLFGGMIDLPNIIYSAQIGKSLLKKDEFRCQVGKLGIDNVPRLTRKGDLIDVYRNLNKSGMYSVRQREGIIKNKVSGYASAILVKSPRIIISEASRQRVLRDKRKNVHGYIRGTFADAYDGNVVLDNLPSYKRLTYSPYIGGFFFEVTRDKSGKVLTGTSPTPFRDISSYAYALVFGSDAIIFNV